MKFDLPTPEQRKFFGFLVRLSVISANAIQEKDSLSSAKQRIAISRFLMDCETAFRSLIKEIEEIKSEKQNGR